MKRVIVFVDGSNLYHRIKERGWKKWVDIGDMARRMCGKERQLVAVYYYNVSPPEDRPQYWQQQKYYEQLKKTPNLELRLGWLANSGGVLEEKGVDTQVVVDMMSLAQKDSFDTAILVSCDGDYTPAITAIKGMGKTVENVYFKGSGSMRLRDECIPRKFRRAFLSQFDS